MAVDARGELAPEEQAKDMESRVFAQRVTPDMIILDLAKGLTRDKIAAKYKFKDPATGEMAPFERWMVDIMFKDPALKGRKPSKVRQLPFEFVASTPAEEVPTTPVIEIVATDGDPSEAAVTEGESDVEPVIKID